MEIGFYHPDLGYWQAIDGDIEALLGGYPEGTVNVSLKPGQDYDWLDGEWVYVPPAVDLAAYAANKRWQVETGGISVNGATIDTSRDSQAMITGAYAYSQANPTEAIKFKTLAGFVELDAETMAAIATAIGAHVQECFAVEASVQAAIVGGTITTVAEIDAADWPA